MSTGESEDSSGKLDARATTKAAEADAPSSKPEEKLDSIPAYKSTPKISNDTNNKNEQEEDEPIPTSSSGKPFNSDRADSERIAAASDPPTDFDTIPPRIVPRPISSSPIVITPDSLSPPSAGENAPPSAIMENAMSRGRPQTPISTIVGISVGVLLVIILLALLLFR